MSYSAFAQPYQAEFQARVAGFGPTARMIGAGLSWLGGGIVFAGTVYLMIAIPGLFG